jgi:hypothetical protein
VSPVGTYLLQKNDRARCCFSCCFTQRRWYAFQLAKDLARRLLSDVNSTAAHCCLRCTQAQDGVG